MNIFSDNTDQRCMKVDLPENRTGVLSIGGELHGDFTHSVEILDLGTQVWTEMDSFDDRFVYGFHSLVNFNGKPSIIGGFNATGD